MFAGLTLFYFSHFLILDLKSSTDNTLSDYFEEEFLSKMNAPDSRKTPKVVNVEKNAKKLKMILYSEDMNGGI